MFCKNCGRELNEQSDICPYCGGVPYNSFDQQATEKNRNLITKPTSDIINPLSELVNYEGHDREFPFGGYVLKVPSDMDAFIHYRKVYKHAAKYMRDKVMNDYMLHCQNLDAFFMNFPIMYTHYRRTLVDAAVRILMSNDIFDISREEFEDELTSDFAKCNDLYSALVDAFNKTIEANQTRIGVVASLLPTVIFGGGVFGFAKAMVYNVATTAAVSAALRNANVSVAQRNELYQRINRADLAQNIYQDYWDIHYSLTFRLHNNGARVWYPTKETNGKAQGLMNNIQNNLVPEDKIIPVLFKILEYRPHQANCLEYIVEKYNYNSEAMALADYYGLEDEMGV